jgi:outer membrane PBP1 activator LpoA protein
VSSARPPIQIFLTSQFTLGQLLSINISICPSNQQHLPIHLYQLSVTSRLTTAPANKQTFTPTTRIQVPDPTYIRTMSDDPRRSRPIIHSRESSSDSRVSNSSRSSEEARSPSSRTEMANVYYETRKVESRDRTEHLRVPDNGSCSPYSIHLMSI